MKKSIFVLLMTSLMAIGLASCGGSKETYTITWKDYDSSVLMTSYVKEGEIPVYPGQTLTRENDPAYHYVFSHWTPTPVAASRDASYKAIYTKGDLKTYAITWVDGDGNTLKTEDVSYGETPSYTGTAVPTKTSTATTVYTFANSWSPEIVAVTEAATYTAQFNEEYIITWLDGDGEVLKTESYASGETPSYSGDTPTKTSTVSENYVFNNLWSPSIVAVTGAATYTAQFSSNPQQYAITFMSDDGSETLGTSKVDYGTAASDSGVTASKDCALPYEYVFAGWLTTVGGSTIDDLSNVIADRTVYASFTKSLVNTEGLHYNYQSSFEAYSLSSYTGTATKVVIPGTYDDGENGEHKVTSIYNSAFINSSVEQVYINENVLDIGATCFHNNSHLVSVHLPETLMGIGDSCFYGCSSLTEINFPASLMTIGSCAFFGAEKITSVYLGKSCTSVGDQCFQGCSSLTSFTVDSTNTVYAAVDGVLFYKNLSALCYYPASKPGTTYTIPSTVNTLRTSCFYGSQFLTEITVPSTIKYLYSYLFSAAASLTKITYQGTAQTITPYFAYECKQLTEVVFDTTVDITSFSNQAFGYCSSLVNFSIPSTVTSIGNNCFTGCSKLESINLTDALTTLGDGAFSTCVSLTSITIPKNLVTIPDNAFMNCSKVGSITVDSANTSFATQDNVLYDAGKTHLIFGANASTLTSITLPSTLVSIPQTGIHNWTHLESLFIPSSVTTIGDFGIFYCQKLTKVYCYATSKPSGWVTNWLIPYETYGTTVYWYSDYQPSASATDSYWHMVGTTPTIW